MDVEIEDIYRAVVCGLFIVDNDIGVDVLYGGHVFVCVCRDIQGLHMTTPWNDCHLGSVDH